MKEVDELRNFWKDEKKVEKAILEVEKEILEKEKKDENKKVEKILIKSNLPKEENEKIEIDLNKSNNEKEKRKFIIALIIFIILFIIAVIITFIVVDKIKELKIKNEMNSGYMKNY